MARKKKRSRGRPARPMPEPINDTPENIAWAILNTPPKKADEWRYMQEYRRKLDETTSEESSEC